MRVQRKFPTDQEVEEWMATHLIDDEDGNPTIDQMKAASAESSDRIRQQAPDWIASGRMQWGANNIKDDDKVFMKRVVRQYLAASSAGIASWCPHTQLIRPQLLICDPPVVVCQECVAAKRVNLKRLEEGGWFWGYQCDRCGADSEMLHEVVSTLGHFTVIGHVCPQCGDEDQKLALQRTDRVVEVKRNPFTREV